MEFKSLMWPFKGQTVCNSVTRLVSLLYVHPNRTNGIRSNFTEKESIRSLSVWYSRFRFNNHMIRAHISVLRGLAAFVTV